MDVIFGLVADSILNELVMAIVAFILALLGIGGS
jgi:hypothetical protein